MYALMPLYSSFYFPPFLAVPEAPAESYLSPQALETAFRRDTF